MPPAPPHIFFTDGTPDYVVFLDVSTRFKKYGNDYLALYDNTLMIYTGNGEIRVHMPEISVLFISPKRANNPNYSGLDSELVFRSVEAGAELKDILLTAEAGMKN